MMLAIGMPFGEARTYEKARLSKFGSDFQAWLGILQYKVGS